MPLFRGIHKSAESPELLLKILTTALNVTPGRGLLISRNLLHPSHKDIEGVFGVNALMAVNKEACRILGRTEAELSHTSWEDFTHPEDLGKDLAELKRVCHKKSADDSYTIPKRYKHPMGHWVSCQLYVHVVREELTDEVTHLIAFIWEIEDSNMATTLKVEYDQKFELLHSEVRQLLSKLDDKVDIEETVLPIDKTWWGKNWWKIASAIGTCLAGFAYFLWEVLQWALPVLVFAGGLQVALADEFNPTPEDNETTWTKWLQRTYFKYPATTHHDWSGKEPDILTPKVVGEVDWWHKSDEGVGQMVRYGRKTKREEVVLILLCPRLSDISIQRKLEQVSGDLDWITLGNGKKPKLIIVDCLNKRVWEETITNLHEAPVQED